MLTSNYKHRGKTQTVGNLSLKKNSWLGWVLLLAMGFHRLPSIRDYWSTDWVLGTQELVKVMPQRRFEEILRYFHVNDNTNMPQRGSPEFDKLYKISPFINEIKTNFLMQYHPNEHQAIDEAMIKFKGRSSLIQYMPKKSTKRGIKMWCRADSGNGYLCDFDIYVGRTSDGIEHDLAFSVVTKLCQTLYGKWHKVFLDNFFTTLKLVEHLFENKVLSCGTFRSGRKGFPKELFDKKEIKKLQRGEVMCRRKGPIVALTWLDNKPVHVVSTFSKPPEEGCKPPVKRRKKDGVQQEVPCPGMISAYNKYMGVVDRNDQMKSYYESRIRTKKWWPRIVFDLIERCAINAHILESESPNHTKKAYKEFRLDLVKQLMEGYSSRKSVGQPSLSNDSRFTGRHFPSFLPLNEAGKRQERSLLLMKQKNKSRSCRMTFWLFYTTVAVFLRKRDTSIVLHTHSIRHTQADRTDTH